MDIEIILPELARTLEARGRSLATAESCTGGLISAACTDMPGSSLWFKGGVVAYANEVKTGLLGVSADVLAQHGAVSEAVVRLMAENGRRALCADYCVAVSGIAGPSGGSPQKPVGTVWMAWASAGGVTAKRFLFHGHRASVRDQSVWAALQGVLDAVRREGGG